MGQTIQIQTPEGSFSGYLATPAGGKTTAKHPFRRNDPAADGPRLPAGPLS